MESSKHPLIVHHNVVGGALSNMLEGDFKIREAQNILAHYIVTGSSSVAFYVLSDTDIIYK
jgi:hypothetical protein